MFQFHQPETGWRLQTGLTFEDAVDAIIKHRLANPRFSDKWSTDWNDVADELDRVTCKRIKYHKDYCTEGDTAPKKAPGPSLPKAAGHGEGVVAGAKKIVVGIGVLFDWLGSGAKAVDSALAEIRAQTCARCPLNGNGDLTSLFTVPASRMIQQQIEIKTKMRLATSLDDSLGVCDACLCPLKLKVHTPLEHILERLSEDQKAQLHPDCWMLKE